MARIWIWKLENRKIWFQSTDFCVCMVIRFVELIYNNGSDDQSEPPRDPKTQKKKQDQSGP